MWHARETTLTFFITYLSPLKPKACEATKIFFSLLLQVAFHGVKFIFFTLMQVVALVAELLLYTYQ